jgi:hypothetical protein
MWATSRTFRHKSSSWLVTLKAFEGDTCNKSIGDGHTKAAAGIRPDGPPRSRKPVRWSRLPAATEAAWVCL